MQWGVENKTVINVRDVRVSNATPGNEPSLAPAQTVRHNGICGVIVAALSGAPGGGE